MTTSKERRRHYRAAVQTDVWIGQDGIFTRARAMIRDLSERGAFIETSPTSGIGSVLSLRFRVPPDNEEVTCSAMVRHTRGGLGFGVEFIDLAPEAFECLRRFLGHEVDTYLSEHR